MAALGMILFMLGASGMDSNSLLAPATMAVVGIVMVFIEGRRKAWI